MRALVLAVLVGAVGLVPAAGAAALHDAGIFSDLDARVHVTLPGHVDESRARLRLDDARRVVVLFEADQPLKAYRLSKVSPAGTPVSAVLGLLDPDEASELRRLVTDATTVERAVQPSSDDRDGDGIPDRLDVLMGARKLVLNGAAYREGYYRIAFPDGDVPRQVGVCSDTIVRAFRNAGWDLQKLVADDIRANRAAYPDVTQPNSSIDHRRVKTLLIWFRRHMVEVHDDPPRPGDVVFLDTFPRRPGPDHVGIISDRIAPSGKPFVINNWTVGYREGEMDLLPFVPVTHRFRIK